MEPTTPRRTGALLLSAALLASLTVATVAAPASAAKPTCDGKVATIVSQKKVINGTSRGDVIVARGNKDNIIYGKGGHDRICAGFGDDRVLGGPGNDRIFGGSGDDDLFGQTGRDDLFGFTGTDVMNGGAHDDFLSGGAGDDRMEGGPGNDVAQGGLGPDSIGGSAGDDKLYGQVGNDEINGGPGTDVCVQGQGTGPITACEDGVADMAVTVDGPVYLNPAPGELGTWVVRVTNNGPATAGYQLSLSVVQQGVICDGQGAWSGVGSVQAALAAGQQRDHSYQMYCDDQVAPATTEFKAAVIAQANDPSPANNAASLVTQWD